MTEDELSVDLVDGRTITVPLVWFPRLVHGTKQERDHWEFNGRGIGIHWPELDEDISVVGLLAGRPSCEGPKTFKKWLDARADRKTSK
ncbi:MAG: DUF2442 domain-containing protein [Phycisphaera sp.]|nr:DUF2442 domain-containing protein [Phycisphaera sp.]